MTCPKCESARRAVRESRRCINGTQRRRIECLACGHRWTEWSGERAQIGVHRNPRLVGRPSRFSEEQVRVALTRVDLNNREAAELLDCSAEMVRQIRCGLVYRNVLPHLIRPKEQRPRWRSDGPRCDQCEHWTGERCSWGFPDPTIEGWGFAADCELYRKCDDRLTAQPVAA